MTVTSARNALGHLNPQNPGLGFDRADYGWLVSYSSKQLHAMELHQAALDLWRAIRHALGFPQPD